MDSSKPKRTVSRKRAAEPAAAVPPVEQSKPARSRKSNAKACAPATPTEPLAVEVTTPSVAVPEIVPAVAVVAEVVAAPAPVVDTTPASVAAAVLTPDEVAELAYLFWVDRGCPMGSPDSDWLRAEQELRRKKRTLVNA